MHFLLLFEIQIKYNMIYVKDKTLLYIYIYIKAKQHKLLR